MGKFLKIDLHQDRSHPGNVHYEASQVEMQCSGHRLKYLQGVPHH
jgi:hypothetical protein